ncbi:TPMT family class I SAM-dependent methyltransferase [Weeksellaceae bacterium KMM 9713]|uniref:TPMT family class I SAM-dependent methyltransferase n=1 Tax=Profundicola chukchiensis TaxID=2961959 RepID=A0A9X4RX49_9FLAO|nr:methyltransferase domain-containing protein [Profundicola chukchiensis]MDG4946512.1 TPMT family class I SAM-dependent methyltransferase [Profundicola chukchiensis]
MNKLDKEFWNQRWRNGETGWDIGYASPAIVDYFDKIEDKEINILIPGCGNAYEAEALRERGFKNIRILDISDEAVARLKEKYKDRDEIEVIHQDFFDHQGLYDYIIEQTFFCALNPNLRQDHAEKMHELLRPKGVLVGLMFNKNFESDGPPFGGTKEEYQPIFEPYFNFIQFDKTDKSIPPRLGSEIFIELQKK